MAAILVFGWPGRFLRLKSLFWARSSQIFSEDGTIGRLGVATAHWLPSCALAALFALFLTFNGSHLLYSAAEELVPVPHLGPAAPGGGGSNWQAIQ